MQVSAPRALTWQSHTVGVPEGHSGGAQGLHSELEINRRRKEEVVTKRKNPTQHKFITYAYFALRCIYCPRPCYLSFLFTSSSGGSPGGLGAVHPNRSVLPLLTLRTRASWNTTGFPSLVMRVSSSKPSAPLSRAYLKALRGVGELFVRATGCSRLFDADEVWLCSFYSLLLTNHGGPDTEGMSPEVQSHCAEERRGGA